MTKTASKKSSEIVKIPATMEKFFGGSGYMVKPDLPAVVDLIKKIPKGKVATLDSIREKLAKKNKVMTSCPAATMKSIKAAIKEDGKLCYWRVIKGDGKLIGQFPGAVKGHAEKLESEGFAIDSTKKDPRVSDFEKKLYSFK